MSSTAAHHVVEKLLQNSLDPAIVREIVAPDATYMSLTYENPELKKILPYCGVQPEGGPDAVLGVFGFVNKIWAIEDFDIKKSFSSGENAAVFGSMRYRSKTLGKVFTSPFSIWATVIGGKITYMQFLEDTLLSTSSFKEGGEGPLNTYIVDPETNERVTA
ncbi:hypothetical protein BGW36DRAFT_412243 [Talaromyces proteolyticus]|uniref:SnoaL-like domain-containing protein n=1 Tax=Talaromyces proteolyticus TaxID=1131652 RepID=A0AAD4PUJ6_9EURO|nr:uncharacterized protein BGW36DRAFT_412243 [Talaromyces proteolyticus]KAH8689445.1 hypothetical protein BGW36DRAFT_412243 [Talaromyces proteolyticus]